MSITPHSSHPSKNQHASLSFTQILACGQSVNTSIGHTGSGSLILDQYAYPMDQEQLRFQLYLPPNPVVLVPITHSNRASSSSSSSLTTH